jgi:hypothetical protein
MLRPQGVGTMLRALAIGAVLRGHIILGTAVSALPSVGLNLRASEAHFVAFSF